MNSKMTDIFTLQFFEKRLKHYAKKNPLLLKKDYESLLDLLEQNPINEFSTHLKDEAYKIRLKNSSSNKGKSAGYRIITYVVGEKSKIYLVSIYSKSEQDNILDAELKELIENV